MNNETIQIQSRLNVLANKCLVADPMHRGYSDLDLTNASLVFTHVLLDEIFTTNKGMSQPKLEEIAVLTGKAIRELILASTGKDMHEVVKNLN